MASAVEEKVNPDFVAKRAAILFEPAVAPLYKAARRFLRYRTNC
jgi:hypothetical protein